MHYFLRSKRAIYVSPTHYDSSNLCIDSMKWTRRPLPLVT